MLINKAHGEIMYISPILSNYVIEVTLIEPPKKCIYKYVSSPQHVHGRHAYSLYNFTHSHMWVSTLNPHTQSLPYYHQKPSSCHLSIP